MPIWEYDGGMARAATTSDVFNAIAEPQRREILVLLRAGERPVTALARELRMTQPGASKHLRVLREVGLVRDRRAGRRRLYGLDARGLRPVHQWARGFERFWNESLDRLDEYGQDLRQVLPPSLFEHPAAELSVDDSVQLGKDGRQPDHIA
jgi:DNA-binding transcriptional ArsR family regulator